MSRIPKYADVQVKIGFERGKLIDETKMKELAEVKTVSDLVNELKETSYGEKLARIFPPFAAIKLERIFRQDLLDALIKIVKNSPRIASGFLRNFVIKFEYENIVNILRTINNGSGLEEESSRIYFAAEDFLHNREAFERALKATDIPSAVGILTDTSNKPPLALGLKRYEETGSTRFFEFLLDKGFHENLGKNFEDLPKREQRHAAFYAKAEIDGYILTTILRGKLLNYDLPTLRVLIPQCRFRLTENTVETLLESGNFDEALEIILSTAYGRYLVMNGDEEETIMSLSKNLKKAVFDYASKKKTAEVFTIGAPLSLILQKQVEVQNLVKLSLGIEYGLKPEKIIDSFMLRE